MNVQRIMEDVILKQHVQIQLVVSHVNVKLVILEMVSVVMVFIYFLSFLSFFLLFTFLKKIDINECSTNNGGCSTNALCTNTQGSFSCACKTGYSGDGATCTGNDFVFSSLKWNDVNLHLMK